MTQVAIIEPQSPVRHRYQKKEITYKYSGLLAAHGTLDLVHACP